MMIYDLLWEVRLNTDLDAKFINIQDWKGILEKAGEVNCTKVYKTNDGDFLLNSQWVLH
jgi:hypothetical protein